MKKSIRLVFDFVSPNAYLIWGPLCKIAEEKNASVEVFPVFLAGMHRLTGNEPPMIRDAGVKGKVEYAMLEMQRFIAKHKLVNYRLHPNFPFNSITIQRMLFVANQHGRAIDFVEAVLPAIWEQGIDLVGQEDLSKVVESAGFDASALFERTQTAEVKDGLVINTQKAVDLGVFGIPSMFIGEEMFFGKERLDQVEEALS